MESLDNKEIFLCVEIKKELSKLLELTKKVRTEGVKEGIDRVHDLFTKLVNTKGETKMLRKAVVPDFKKEIADLRCDVVAMLAESRISIVESIRGVTGDRPGTAADLGPSEVATLKSEILEAIAGVKTGLPIRNPEPSWTEVTKRRPKKEVTQSLTVAQSKKPIQPPPRVKKLKPAIIVDTKPEDFPALARKIQQGVNPKIFGNSVVGMRQTRSGGMLIQIDGDSTAVEAVKMEVTKAAGEGTSVRTLSQKGLVEVRDIASWADKEDVLQAFVCADVSPEDTRIINIRKVYGGSLAVTVLLPLHSAERIASVG